MEVCLGPWKASDLGALGQTGPDAAVENTGDQGQLGPRGWWGWGGAELYSRALTAEPALGRARCRSEPVDPSSGLPS